LYSSASLQVGGYGWVVQLGIFAGGWVWVEVWGGGGGGGGGGGTCVRICACMRECVCAYLDCVPTYV